MQLPDQTIGSGTAAGCKYFGACGRKVTDEFTPRALARMI